MTRPRITLALAIAALLLGTAHCALTTLLYPLWTIDALWFVGTGLAMMITAAANISGLDTNGRMSRAILLLINLVMVGFFAAAWLVLPQPQVIIGGALFAGLAVMNRKVRSEQATA